VSRTPEGAVKDDVKALLKSMGIWYYMPVSNGMGQHGIPDFICCMPDTGKFLAIETKAPGRINTVTPLQTRVIEQIRSHKGWALVVDDVEDLRDFLMWGGRV
jgi:VRR-NUC domain